MATFVAAHAVTSPRRQQYHYLNRLENTNHSPYYNSSASSPATDVGTTFGTSPLSPSEASTASTLYSPIVDGSSSSVSNTAAKYRPAQTPGHHRIPAPPIPLLQPSRPAPVPTRSQTQLSTVPKESRAPPPAKHDERPTKDSSGNIAWNDRSRSRSLFGFRSSRNHSSHLSWGRSTGSKSSRADPPPLTKPLSASKSLGEVEIKRAAQKPQQNELQAGQTSYEARAGKTQTGTTNSDTRAGPDSSPTKGHRTRWSQATGYNATSGQNAMSPAPKPSTSTSHRDPKSSTSVSRNPSSISNNRSAAPNIAPATGAVTPSTSISSRGQASVFSRTHTRSSSANTAATTPSTFSGRDMNSSTAAAAAAAAVMGSPAGFMVEPDSSPTLRSLQPEPLNVSDRSAIVPDAPDTPGRTTIPSVPYAINSINAASLSTTSLTSGGGRRLRPRGFSLTSGGGGSSSPSASVGRLGSLTGGWTAGWSSGNGWSPSGWSNGLRATRQAPGSPVGGSCTANPGIVTGAVSSSVVNGYSDESPSPSGRRKSRRDVGNGSEFDRRRDRSNGRRGRSNSATPRTSPGSTTSLLSSPGKPSPPPDSSKPSPVDSLSSHAEAFPPLSATPSTTTLASPTSPGSHVNKPWPPLPLHLRRRRASTPASPSRPRPLVVGATVPSADSPQPSGLGISTARTTPSSSSGSTPTQQAPLPQTPMSATSISTTGTESTIRASAHESQSSTTLLLPKKSGPQPATPTVSKVHPPPPKAGTVPPPGAGANHPPRRTSFSSLAAQEAQASFQNSRRGGSGGLPHGGKTTGGSGFSWRRTSFDNAARQNKPTTAPGSRSASRGRSSSSENRGRGPSSGRASDDRGIGGVRREGSTCTVQAAVMPALLLLGTELFTPGKRPEDVGFGRAVAAGGAVRGVGGAGKAVGVLEVDDLDDTEDAAGDARAQQTTAPSTRYHSHHHQTSSSSGLSYSHTPPQSTLHSRSQSSSTSYQPPPPSSSAASATYSPHFPFSVPSKPTSLSKFHQPAPKPKPSLSLLPSIPQSLPQTPSPLPSNPPSHRSSQTHSHANSAPLPSTTFPLPPPPPSSHSHTTSSSTTPAPAPAPFVSRLDPGSTCPFTVDASSGHFDLPGSQKHGEPFRRPNLSPPVSGLRDLGREGDLMAGMEAVWRKWEGAVA